MDGLVDRPQGPPGVIAVVQRGPRVRVFRAGVAEIDPDRPLGQNLHMRIASTAKASSGGVALKLVNRGVLALENTIGERLPWAPREWRRVTLGQALHHTSGLPDFSQYPDFIDYVLTHLDRPLPPRGLLRFVADQDLEFTPGTRYKYSNSDNIVVGLMVQDATGRRYEQVLRSAVTAPLGLDRTTLPRGKQMPLPFIHGYDRETDGSLTDVSEILAAGYAWASGGIVSTPADQNRFIRGYVGRRLFDRATQQKQFAFRPGSSEPTGPGVNSAGLAVFRYRTSCGTMYGHTGNTLGYTQFFAASLDGRRSAVVALNRQIAPPVVSHLYPQVRAVFRLAACAALD